VAVRHVERDDATFEELREGGAAHPEEVGRLLGREQQALGSGGRIHKVDVEGLDDHDVERMVGGERGLTHAERALPGPFALPPAPFFSVTQVHIASSRWRRCTSPSVLAPGGERTRNQDQAS
jgi:hypothetical protein